MRLFLFSHPRRPTLEMPISFQKDNCGGVNHLNIYSEHLLPLKETILAMKSFGKETKYLQYINNLTLDLLDKLKPPSSRSRIHRPLFDRLLPSFVVLDSLCVTATDISVEAFRFLPATLRVLSVLSLNFHSAFNSAADLLDILHDPTVHLSLQTFNLYDSSADWDASDLALLKEAFGDRGIEFNFFPDVLNGLEEEYSEGN